MNALNLLTIETWLRDAIAFALPFARDGVLIAACVIALSRLPLLNIAALAAAGVCLGAVISTGPGETEAGMQMVAAGVVAAGVLLLSGGELWRRPELRALWRRAARSPRSGDERTGPLATPDAAGHSAGDDALNGATSGNQSAGASMASTWLYRLAAVAVVALAARALAPAARLGVPVADVRLFLWLAGMGLFAGLSHGSVLVSGAGYVLAMSGITLLMPILVPDVTQQPLGYAAIPVLMIVTALGFSFAAVLRRGE